MEPGQRKSKSKPLPEGVLRYIEEFNRKNPAVFRAESWRRKGIGKWRLRQNG